MFNLEYTHKLGYTYREYSTLIVIFKTEYSY